MTDTTKAGPWASPAQPDSPPQATTAPEPVNADAVEFVGRRWPLFKMSVVTGFWTILTLGFYRFWMKTRLRRWYWSAIRPGGYPLEYVGDPWEKLLGFLIAVVIMAFYIGIVNLILMFLSFSIFENNFAAYLTSFVGVIPIWFFATYRARRYVLARTRWRGVRFGLEPGAWGYAWRAMVHWAITILTLGLLWPRMTFWLEKYRTDRTFFGTQRLNQGGKWTMLLRAAIPAYGILVLTALFVLWVMVLDPIGEDLWIMGTVEAAIEGIDANWPERLFLLLPLGVAALYAAVHYRVKSRAIMARHKTAGGLGLISNPNPIVIGLIYMIGYIGTAIILMLPFAVLGVIMAFVTMSMGQPMAIEDMLMDQSAWVLYPLAIMIYFTIFLLWGTFMHILITMPVWRHYARTLTVTGAEALADIDQRQRDNFEEAEGFAEALDLGAAI